MTRPNDRRPRIDPERFSTAVSRRGLLKTGALSSWMLALGGMPGLAAARGEDRGPYLAPVPVLDREDDDPDPAFVVWSTDIPIEDWTVFGDETVADHNPGYDPDEPVVIVVFEDLLESGWPEWRRAKPFELFRGVVDRSVKFHAFPRSRLEIRKRRGKGKGKGRGKSKSKGKGKGKSNSKSKGKGKNKGKGKGKGKRKGKEKSNGKGR